MGKMIAKFRYRVIKQTDARIRTLNLILQGIQTIKIHAWEKPFMNMIQKIRKCELVLTSKSVDRCLIFVNAFQERVTIHPRCVHSARSAVQFFNYITTIDIFDTCFVCLFW